MDTKIRLALVTVLASNEHHGAGSFNCYSVETKIEGLLSKEKYESIVEKVRRDESKKNSRNFIFIGGITILETALEGKEETPITIAYKNDPEKIMTISDTIVS